MTHTLNSTCSNLVTGYDIKSRKLTSRLAEDEAARLHCLVPWMIPTRSHGSLNSNNIQLGDEDQGSCSTDTDKNTMTTSSGGERLEMTTARAGGRLGGPGAGCKIGPRRP